MRHTVVKTLSGLRRFEGLLAIVLALLPILLIAEDGVRGSISAYHDIDDPRWFFIPLTAAVMMLIVNGLVRPDHHGYNAVLGLLLFGVVLFDHDGDSRTVHGISAVAFYSLSFVFIALQVTDYLCRMWSTWSLWRQRIVAIAVLVFEVGLVVVVNAVSRLFWAEAVGLWLIALHYVWHSSRHELQLESDEPTQVFKRLCEPCSDVIALALRPLDRVWKLITQP